MKTTTFGGITREQHDAIQHTSAMIADETIVDADISPSANIAADKIALHGARHATGEADALPDNAITDAMLNFSTWKQIVDISLTSSMGDITFNGLDANTDKTYLLVLLLKNAGADPSHYYIYLENDTNVTHYYSEHLNVSGSTIAGTRENLPCVLDLTPGEGAMCVIFIGLDPNGYPRITSIYNRFQSSGVELGIKAVTKTASTSNITTLMLAATTVNGLGAGSYIGIYKVKTK